MLEYAPTFHVSYYAQTYAAILCQGLRRRGKEEEEERRGGGGGEEEREKEEDEEEERRGRGGGEGGGVKGGGEEEERREKSNRGEKGRPLTNIPTFTLTFGVHTVVSRIYAPPRV